MSRWHLTSSESADREARNVCQQANLRSSGENVRCELSGQAYFKRVATAPNLIKCGESDWICSAGTIIYNDRLGEEALRDCFDDFVAAGVPAVQSKAIGHYALAIKRNNQVSIFTIWKGCA